jgi:uncharacterized protein (DUF1015 family)
VRNRRALIGALELTPYEDGIVFRHELTLKGPKQDRLDLMRATQLHCELIFLMYEDAAGAIAALLDQASTGEPIERLEDEYRDTHSVWRASDPALTGALRSAFAEKRLLIADGHHRYETMLAYRAEQPAAHRILVALVSMNEPGLTILPTHRLLSRVAGFSREAMLTAAERFFDISETSVEAGRAALAPNVIGVAFADHEGFTVLRLKESADLAAALPELSPVQRKLDVVLLHQILLRICLGITEEATKQEKNLEYIREFEKGMDGLQHGAQACFFLHPVSVEQVKEISYAGDVMPQKSTDFYPKMLSGLAMYEAVTG